MTSINSKKRETGKFNKRCLTLDEKIKILDEVKKIKRSSRTISEDFKIGKTQAVSAVKNEAELRDQFENFKGKGFKNIKRKNHQNFKPINGIFYS